MSQWTHVAGVIRVDGLAHVLGYSPEGEQRAITEAVAGSSIPFGSEGPVQYRVDMCVRNSGANRGTITIWGDLRDYDDVEEIAQWFRDLLAKFCRFTVFPFCVRDAVLSINKEGAKKTVLCVFDEKKGMKRTEL